MQFFEIVEIVEMNRQTYRIAEVDHEGDIVQLLPETYRSFQAAEKALAQLTPK